MAAVSSPGFGVLFLLAGFAGLLTVAACQSLEVDRKGDAFGELRMQFLYQGREVPGNLIVSDGGFRQEWTGQKRIAAKVPSVATYIIDLKLPGDRGPQPITFRDVIPEFQVPPGEVRDVIVHVPAPGGPGGFVPFVFVEDRGANARIETRRESIKRQPPRVRLTSSIDFTPGSRVLIDGNYMNDAPTPATARDYTCGDNCPHVFSGVDCSKYCYTCTSTAIYKGYWKANYNMCEGLTTPPPRGSEFNEIPPGFGGIHLAAATTNDSIVYPLRATRSGGGTTDKIEPPLETRSFPDFVAPTGTHLYTVTVPGGRPWQRRELTLPVTVTDYRITQLYITLPTRKLVTGVPVLIGDTRLGIPTRTVASDRTEIGVTFDVRTAGPDPGHAWVLLPIPRGSNAEVFDNTGRELVEGQDYVAMQFGRTPVLVIRTEGRHAQRTVRF